MIRTQRLKYEQTRLSVVKHGTTTIKTVVFGIEMIANEKFMFYVKSTKKVLLTLIFGILVVDLGYN